MGLKLSRPSRTAQEVSTSLEGSAPQEPPSQVIPKQFSYNTGHGDFCFVSRRWYKYEWEKSLRENNVRFIELDGFRRYVTKKELWSLVP